MLLSVFYYSIQAGKPRQSIHPWPPVQSRGGGAVIPCCYYIVMEGNRDQAILQSTVASVKNAVDLLPEKSILIVKTTQINL